MFALELLSTVCALYAIVIKTTKGRCGKTEYLVKAVSSCFLQLTAFLIGFLPFFRYESILFLSGIYLLSSLYFVSITVKRFHDIGKPGSYAFVIFLNPLLLSLCTDMLSGLLENTNYLFNGILTFSIYAAVILCLFFQDSETGINKYDQPVKYSALIPYTITIFKNHFIVDTITFHTEYYWGKYIISFCNHTYYEQNVFMQYIMNRYDIHLRCNRSSNRCSFILTEKELLETFQSFLVIEDDFYILLKDSSVFIRKEDFKYTVVIKKEDLPKMQDTLEVLEEKEKIENGTYLCYKNIEKLDLLSWIGSFRA